MGVVKKNIHIMKKTFLAFIISIISFTFISCDNNNYEFIVTDIISYDEELRDKSDINNLLGKSIYITIYDKYITTTIQNEQLGPITDTLIKIKGKKNKYLYENVDSKIIIEIKKTFGFVTGAELNSYEGENISTFIKLDKK